MERRLCCNPFFKLNHKRIDSHIIHIGQELRDECPPFLILGDFICIACWDEIWQLRYIMKISDDLQKSAALLPVHGTPGIIEIKKEPEDDAHLLEERFSHQKPENLRDFSNVKIELNDPEPILQIRKHHDEPTTGYFMPGVQKASVMLEVKTEPIDIGPLELEGIICTRKNNPYTECGKLNEQLMEYNETEERICRREPLAAQLFPLHPEPDITSIKNKTIKCEPSLRGNSISHTEEALHNVWTTMEQQERNNVEGNSRHRQSSLSNEHAEYILTLKDHMMFHTEQIARECRNTKDLQTHQVECANYTNTLIPKLEKSWLPGIEMKSHGCSIDQGALSDKSTTKHRLVTNRKPISEEPSNKVKYKKNEVEDKQETNYHDHQAEAPLLSNSDVNFDENQDKLTYTRKESNVDYTNNSTNISEQINPNQTLEQEKSYNKSICEKTFAKTRMIKAHILSHSEEEACKGSASKRKRNAFSQSRILTHPEVKPNECNASQKMFESCLRKYKKIETEGLLQECSVRLQKLPNSFLSKYMTRQAEKGNVRSESLTSSDSQKQLTIICENTLCKCSICEETFTISSKLTEHIKIHAEERPHECSICRKTFGRSTSLRSHLSVHSEAEVYEWSMGQKTKANTENSESDMAMHAEERPVKCNVCNEVFEKQSLLKLHSMMHTGKKPYECQGTGRKAQARTKHSKSDMVMHAKERPVECNVCNRVFERQSLLKLHSIMHTRKKSYECKGMGQKTQTKTENSISDMAMHTEEIPVECNVCNKVFKKQSLLELHSIMHTGKKPYECIGMDGKTQTKTKNSESDMAKHTEERPVECNVCNEVFRNQSLLELHSIMHSGEELYDCKGMGQKKQIETKDARSDMAKHTEERPVECYVCNKVFGNQSLLELHSIMHTRKKRYGCKGTVRKTQTKTKNSKSDMVKHTEERPVECNVCNEVFRNQSLLELHSIMHTRKKLYECKGMGQKTQTETKDARSDMAKHTEERPVECNVCNKVFGNQSLLESHSMIHTREKLYECRGMDQKTQATTKNSMNDMALHTKEMPVKCNVCNKVFEKQSLLELHSMMHTGKKPYECEVCAKTFKFDSQFTRHMQVHHNERSHKCSVCEKTFKTSSGFKKHIMRIQCDICGKSFRCCSHLKEHMKIHGAITPYGCSICAKSFMNRSHFIEHMKVHT